MHPSRLSPEQLQRLAIHVVAGGDRHTLQAAAVAEGKTIQTLAAIASLIMSNGIHRVDPVEDDATRNAGFDGHIPKPFALRSFRERMAELDPSP